MSYAIDLDPFYEDTKIKPPVNQGAIVTHNDNQFTVDRWFSARGHCFVFIPVAPGSRIKPFAKRPSEVLSLIAEKKLTVELKWP